MALKGVEVEIKLAVADTAMVRRALRRAGLVFVRRERELDTVLDTANLALWRTKCLLRLRRHGRKWKLTFKGPTIPHPRYKSRPETEMDIPEGQRLLEILNLLGYKPVFTYEKIRTTYRPKKWRAVASVDVTPIGTFLELEGPGPWIDRTARSLGFSPGDYITRSYPQLYLQYCRQQGRRPSNMVFAGTRAPQATPVLFK